MATHGHKRNANGQGGVYRRADGRWEAKVFVDTPDGRRKRKLKSLQAAHIRTWLNDLRTTCQCCVQGRDYARKTARCCALSTPKCCNAVLSASSIRHILRVLRAALQDAVDEELLSRNVARLVQLRVTDDRRVRSFSRDEALRFLAAAEQHRLYALWAVALAMGLRRGEALGLAWADVDLDGGV
jgi:integrase